MGREARMNRMRICVEITLLNDARVFDTLKSLETQSRKADRILLADGGSRREFLDEIQQRFGHLPLEILILKGTIPETREKSLDHVEEEVLVFLDSDQIAPEDWLSSLVKPIEEGKADFSGGPTRPYIETENPVQRYFDTVEERIYNRDISYDLGYLPMGNSAWKTDAIKKMHFDMRLAKWGSEDYDLEMRALDAGYRGFFVKEAWVYHNKSAEKSYFRLMKRRYRYLKSTALVLIKNRRVRSRITWKNENTGHPFEMLETAMKPVAFMHAYIYYHTVFRRT